MISRKAARMLVVLALAATVGCGGSSNDPVEPPEVPVPPTPNTPQNAVKLLEWCWDERDNTLYRDVFTDDFTYQFAVSDSQSVGTTINRNEELAFADNLFESGVAAPPAPAGGSGVLALPAASRVVLGVNANLTAQADSRPGKDPTWHKEIATRLNVNVTTPAGSYSIASDVRFFITRGDSALIPADMVARGFAPDPNRWYIDSWADETVCPVDKRCQTVGRLKVDYLGAPPRPSRP
jgi:hypothetical protein